MDDSSYTSREPMLEMFIFETNQLLDQLEELLLLCEKENSLSSATINEIFRIMHTIKGSSGMMLFNNISSLAHSVEDLFYYIRENKVVELDYSAICDLVLAASDFIKGEIVKIESDKQADGTEDELVNKIKQYLSKLKGNENEPSNIQSSSMPEDVSKKFYISSYKNNQTIECPKYTAKVWFEEGAQMENIRAYTIVHHLKDISQELYHRPFDVIENDLSADYIVENGFDIYFSSTAKFEDVEKIFNEALCVKSFRLKKTDNYLEEISDLVEEPDKSVAEGLNLTICTPKNQNHDDEKASVSRNLKQNLISVNTIKLDKLMDLVGEIVITEAMLTRNPDLIGLHLDNFGKVARQLRKLHDELQDVVMSIRMIPIAATFHKMQRIVRDMGKQLGKEAELIILGEETEVDKNIIDNLSDPLMHLIRNAMDHGLECIEERKKAGKPVKGKIILVAKNTGGDVIISVSDDGKGLNRDKILRKAAENGLVTKPESELSDREVFSFIMKPGFSTKEQVTEFSGRGVGMDVVKSNIEKVGGTISIESNIGQGTTFFIKIPLTLAIINGMQVAVANSIYTIPTVSIKESFRPAENAAFSDPDGNEMIMIRGICYPIIRLHKLFSIETEVTKLSQGIIVVTECDNRTICLYADCLLGEQQVVVKPLPHYLTRYQIKEKGVGGCTILGDGNISLILNTAEIIKSVTMSYGVN